MPRRDDIGTAFRAALMTNPKGYLWLRTDDFIRELAVKNWHFTQEDANNRIIRYQFDFADQTPDHSENRLWLLRNMGMVH